MIDVSWKACYNNFRWLQRGEMAERLMALVLKTSDTERYRGFESLSLRQFPSLKSFKETKIILTGLWRSTQVTEGAPLLRE